MRDTIDLTPIHRQMPALATAMARYGRAADILWKIVNRCRVVDNGYEGGPCLEWQGPCSGAPGRGRAKGRGHSYPRMNLDGCTVAVHRAFWVNLNGYLPPKKQLDHLCRSRRCVIHCEPVTHKENQRRKPK
jgi:hypothetical protein